MHRDDEETTSRDSDMSATEIQQEYYEAMGDADWELYEKKDRKHLLQKIAIALCGPPTKEGNLLDESDSELKLQGYGVREEEVCMEVFEKICQQAKYSHNGENVLISIIRVLCVIPKDPGLFTKNPADHWDNLELKKGKKVSILVFHVFCVRRCISVKSGGKTCRVYIDHDGRVYQNWNSYLTENKLPKGMMVVPKNGEYRGNIIIREMKNDGDVDFAEMPKVKLTVVLSPAMSVGSRVLEATDITSTVASIGAVGTLIGAAFATPVVAPVLAAGAVATGVGTAVYGIVRSSMNLADRGQHQQSIGLENSDARGNWINIVMSTVGISFSAAAKLIAWAASTGTNVRILINALQFLKYTNLATGLVGVVNSLGDMIYKFTKYGEAPSGVEIFQFTTSALFLGIGVMSNATAQEIVQDAQAKTINEARDTLSSNMKRKMFDKVTAENRRIHGAIDGNAETIRGLKVISNKNEFFAKLGRINKDMNKNKVRISLTSDGKTLINNQHKVSLNKLYGIGKEGRSNLLGKFGPADVTTKNVPTRLYVNNPVNSSVSMVSQTAIEVRPEEIIKITTFLLQLCKADQDLVAEVVSHMTASIHDAFLLVCAEVVSTLVPILDRDFKIRLVYFIFDYIKSKAPECDYENDPGFVLVLKSWIKHGRVDKEIILMLKDKFMESFSKVETGAFHSDPQNYDYICEFRKRNRQFMTLRAGEVMSIGGHKVRVKAATVDYLEEWLEHYSQKKCDLLLELTFKIITHFTAKQIDSLIMINPDDDIILRVAHYLFNEITVYILLEEFEENGIMPKPIVMDVRDGILHWRSQQKVRKHNSCNFCNGISYE